MEGHRLISALPGDLGGTSNAIEMSVRLPGWLSPPQASATDESRVVTILDDCLSVNAVTKTQRALVTGGRGTPCALTRARSYALRRPLQKREDRDQIGRISLTNKTASSEAPLWALNEKRTQASAAERGR